MKILILNCHNRENSFCSALAKAYEDGAISSGHDLKTLNLRDLDLVKYLRTDMIKYMYLKEMW
jgi:putative NADPH-quinone reductase